MFSFPSVFSNKTWEYEYNLLDFVTSTAHVIPASWNSLLGPETVPLAAVL